MNIYCIGQWKFKLRYLQEEIKVERDRLVMWYGEDAINNLEFSIYLHSLYLKADRIIGKIQEEESYPHGLA